MNNSRKKTKGKNKAPSKTTKRPKKLTTKESTQVIRFLVKKDGTLETKEERKKRLARREALTLRAFQMAYDNYHNAPGMSQRIAMDALLAISARRRKAVVVTENWNDFKAIQHFCNVKLIKASDFFS